MTALTPANQLTLLRVLLIPAFVILIVYGHLGAALLVFVVAGLTDMFDGLIARRTGQSSLGAWLDPMADKLLLVTTFVVLTMPGLGLANRLPVWLTVLIISRDVVIVLTVAIVNLAIGPRTFRPSIFGKIATATYIVTAVVAMFYNYLGYHSAWVDFFIYLSLAITLVSSLHYIRHAARTIDLPHPRPSPVPAAPRVRDDVKKTSAMIVALGLGSALAGLTPAAGQAPGAPKQAVVDTTAGTFVLDLLPDAAPNSVAHFTKLAQDGAYEGTIFHRVVRYGMVQGGDPISRDPAKRSSYGTGGLNQLKAEARATKLTRGSAAVVLAPGRPDSGGAQFFIVLADQPALDNQYTVFAQVSDGMDVLMKISETPAAADGMAAERIEIKKVTIRDTPPERFVTESAAELGAYRAVLDTSMGPIAIEFFPDKAPGHVRQFLKLADAGVYNGTAFHRVAPGFVIQTGALNTRAAPLTEKQQKLVVNLQPEFNDTKHVKGIVSMARGEDPASATTSFFICTGTSTALDGVYTAFGRVVEGMAVVEAIEAVPRTGEAPNTRIDLKSVRIEQRP